MGSIVVSHNVDFLYRRSWCSMGIQPCWTMASAVASGVTVNLTMRLFLHFAQSIMSLTGIHTKIGNVTASNCVFPLWTLVEVSVVLHDTVCSIGLSCAFLCCYICKGNICFLVCNWNLCHLVESVISFSFWRCSERFWRPNSTSRMHWWKSITEESKPDRSRYSYLCERSTFLGIWFRNNFHLNHNRKPSKSVYILKSAINNQQPQTLNPGM